MTPDGHIPPGVIFISVVNGQPQKRPRGQTHSGYVVTAARIFHSTHQLIYSSLCDSDVDPDAPICIGMDYNANINWIVAGQPRDRRLNIIKPFYVKFERKIPALVEDFCR